MGFNNNPIGNNNNLGASIGSIGAMGYQKNVAAPRNPNSNKINAQNLALNIDQNDITIKAKILHAEADVFGKDADVPIGVDNLQNIKIDARNATVSLSGKELSNTVNNLARKESPMIKNVSFDFMPNNQAFGEVKIKKFINLNLKVKGELDANPINNMVRFTPSDISLNGIPVKKVMDFFGLKIGELVQIGKPSGSFFTSDDSIYFSPTKLAKGLDLDAHVTDIQTSSGSISVFLGEDGISPYQPKPHNGANNYIHAETTNMNFQGFNLKNTDLTLVDGTPNDPFDLLNDPSKKVITRGQLTIPESFIDTALKKKSEGGSMKGMRFTMPNGDGHLTAKKWGFLPISLDLKFVNSDNGALKVTPDNGKLFGFIPLPDSMLRKALVTETDGHIEGNGVVVDLGKLADLETAPFKKVTNSDGKLILEM
ncbi:MAG: hypothetical protein U0457_21860 [Candidatus Sericytochromatia bacterium]